MGQVKRDYLDTTIPVCDVWSRNGIGMNLMYRILAKHGVPLRTDASFDLYLRSMAHTTDADTGPHGE